MGQTAGLVRWLATLDAAALCAVLEARPDAAQRPEPRDVAELAGRLTVQHSVRRAIELVSTPALQVGVALLALGGAASRAELLALLDISDDASAAKVGQALDELFGLALAWPVGDAVRIAGAWREVFHYPLRLGRPARELFAQLTLDQLQRIGVRLGIEGVGRKSWWVETISATVADPATVERRLHEEDPELAEVVQDLAWHGPRIGGVHFPSAYGFRSDEIGTQLAVSGWVVPVEWSIGEMPREVALAVRGPGYHPAFDAEPPPVAAAPVDVERLRAAGQHASAAALEAVRRLVGLVDREPLPTVQAGGVGVRELRKAAKRLGGDEAAVRLWLESAACAGLVTMVDDAALLTRGADEWLAADPAPALATLLLAWRRAPVVPTHRVDDRDKPMPALSRGWGGVDAAQLRADVLGALASLGTGRGIVDEDEIATLLAFRRPIVHGAVGIRASVRATLAEAVLLGVVADGALTPLGLDLLAAADTADPAGSLASALAGALPALTRTATFLPDLTAIVAGSAAPELARLLDDTAVAESRDAASTWRFTPDSVRGALDAGRSADELLAALGGVADNPLPQPLEYLVRDVARRHGQVQVFAVMSCVRVADAALGAEVAANRVLAGLKLRVLSDTVLTSSASVTDTITALRKAGYAPVRQDASGTTVVERTKPRRATIARRMSPAAHSEGPDLAKLAARITGRQSGSSAAVEPRLDPEDVPLLQPAEVRVLGHAIAERLPILIDYVNAAGNTSRRVVEPRARMFDTLVAFCREKQADRNFVLGRITAVSPVPD